MPGFPIDIHITVAECPNVALWMMSGISELEVLFSIFFTHLVETHEIINYLQPHSWGYWIENKPRITKIRCRRPENLWLSTCLIFLLCIAYNNMVYLAHPYL